MYTVEFLQQIGQCAHDITLSHGLYFSMFLAGIVGGFMHCSAMCGPFVLSQSGNLQKLRHATLLPYHAGRITTYTLMAIGISTILGLAFVFLPIRSYVVAPILMLAGLIFIVSAFPSLLRIFPWVGQIRWALPYRFLSKGLEKVSRRNGIIHQYMMGLLLGFMPCGMIVSALMAAATAPHPLQSGLAMATFGIGTMPALISVAVGGSILKNKYPHAMRRVTQGMMVFSALWLFAIAGFILI